MSSKNNDKVAVITIGRLQPPHKGHDVLIRDTVQLARDLGGDPFVWISPSRTDGRDDLEQGEVPERTERPNQEEYQRFQRYCSANQCPQSCCKGFESRS